MSCDSITHYTMQAGWTRPAIRTSAGCCLAHGAWRVARRVAPHQASITGSYNLSSHYLRSDPTLTLNNMDGVGVHRLGGLCSCRFLLFLVVAGNIGGDVGVAATAGHLGNLGGLGHSLGHRGVLREGRHGGESAGAARRYGTRTHVSCTCDRLFIFKI